MNFDEIAAIIRSGNSDKFREIIEAGKVRDINMQNYVNMTFPIAFYMNHAGQVTLPLLDCFLSVDHR